MIRLAFALVFALATPAFAQEVTRDSLTPAPIEAVPAPGTVALRIANATDCPFAIRVKQNGQVVGIGLVKPHALQWAHFRAGGGVFEVEVVVSPRLCGATMPVSPVPQTAPDRGTVRALSSSPEYLNAKKNGDPRATILRYRGVINPSTIQPPPGVLLRGLRGL